MRQFSRCWLGKSYNYTTEHWSMPILPDAAIKLHRNLLKTDHRDLAKIVLEALLSWEPMLKLPSPRRP